MNWRDLIPYFSRKELVKLQFASRFCVKAIEKLNPATLHVIDKLRIEASDYDDNVHFLIFKKGKLRQCHVDKDFCPPDYDRFSEVTGCTFAISAGTMECLKTCKTVFSGCHFWMMPFDISNETANETMRTMIFTAESQPTTYSIATMSHKCAFCPYSSAFRGNLTVHTRTHTGDKPHKCDLCSYASVQSTRLKEHMRTHTGEKPYKCSWCLYSTTESRALKRHARTHTGDKPYKCSLCSYASVAPDALQKHIRTHTGEKPYKCSLCSHASVTQSALIAHSRTHTRAKPFKCNLCSYACGEAYILQKHVRTHTGEKPYKCTLCSYAGASQSALTVHSRKHTGE